MPFGRSSRREAAYARAHPVGIAAQWTRPNPFPGAEKLLKLRAQRTLQQLGEFALTLAHRPSVIYSQTQMIGSGITLVISNERSKISTTSSSRGKKRSQDTRAYIREKGKRESSSTWHIELNTTLKDFDPFR
ncbi:hypothetical protein PGT21_021752 [Puccinia graminis f. sp. tritici]|uniref:Uncharacterized protein n=1 Tax=Puccinia graminis f. sp. tritici TaxID=56615 RepID=A0A5B0QP73_PUCGR|nr:hypothetical protein PGT21_021752 [Puccinia graminis f. sp. tritici]